MYFPGHIALSYLSSRYLNTEVKVAIAAGLFPDVFDKFCYYVLRITPAARVPAHALAGLAVTLLVVWVVGALFRRPWLFAYSWAVAYGLHLISDLLNGPMHFLSPFVSNNFTSYESIQENWAHAVLFEVVVTVIVEIGVTLWAVIIWRRSRRAVQAGR